MATLVYRTLIDALLVYTLKLTYIMLTCYSYRNRNINMNNNIEISARDIVCIYICVSMCVYVCVNLDNCKDFAKI